MSKTSSNVSYLAAPTYASTMLFGRVSGIDATKKTIKYNIFFERSNIEIF